MHQLMLLFSFYVFLYSKISLAAFYFREKETKIALAEQFIGSFGLLVSLYIDRVPLIYVRESGYNIYTGRNSMLGFYSRFGI